MRPPLIPERNDNENQGPELSERRGDEQNIGSETDGQQRRSHRISSLCGCGSGLHCTATTQATSLSPPFDLGHDTSRTFRGQKARQKQEKKPPKWTAWSVSCRCSCCSRSSHFCSLHDFSFFLPFQGEKCRRTNAEPSRRRWMDEEDDERGWWTRTLVVD